MSRSSMSRTDLDAERATSAIDLGLKLGRAEVQQMRHALECALPLLRRQLQRPKLGHQERTHLTATIKLHEQALDLLQRGAA